MNKNYKSDNVKIKKVDILKIHSSHNLSNLVDYIYFSLLVLSTED